MHDTDRRPPGTGSTGGAPRSGRCPTSSSRTAIAGPRRSPGSTPDGPRRRSLRYSGPEPRAVDRPTGLERLGPCARASTNPAETDVVIVTACRLETWKGHRLLLEGALGRLQETCSRAGRPGWPAGSRGRTNRRTSSELGAGARFGGGIEDRVRFLGERDDVPRLLAAADVYCQPNVAPESFGIAFVEALYAGLPAVSTRLGGAAEIVTDACGVLVPPADPDAPRFEAALGLSGSTTPSRQTRSPRAKAAGPGARAARTVPRPGGRRAAGWNAS